MFSWSGTLTDLQKYTVMKCHTWQLLNRYLRRISRSDGGCNLKQIPGDVDQFERDGDPDEGRAVKSTTGHRISEEVEGDQKLRRASFVVTKTILQGEYLYLDVNAQEKWNPDKGS